MWGACIALSSLVQRPVDAAEIRVHGLIPGAGVVSKNVESMRERRYTNLVQQRLDFSCGAAAVATILTYAYGYKTSEALILRDMLKIADEETVYRLGFSLLDIKGYAESLGLQGIGFRLAPENLEQVKLPTIVLLDIKGYKHFVVMRRAEGDIIHIADPALGNKRMKKEDFLSYWNGIVFAIVGENYDEGTVLHQPLQRVSARKLLGERAPFFHAELLDFGFRNADLF